MRHHDKTPLYKIPKAADVRTAARHIQSLAVTTPVLDNPNISNELGVNVLFKCENLQRSGAFKFRGALNAVTGLLESESVLGLATHSSGNHGLALATAAALHDLPAEIVVPENAVASKIKAIEAAGGRVHICSPTQKDREAGLARLVKQGLTPVPPYDHPLVIAGQGTAALEFIEHSPQLDAILTPVGGGGLLAGTCLAVVEQNSGARVYAAEPAGADDAYQSLKAGQRVLDVVPDTIADGLRATIGELTFPIIQRHVQKIFRVSDKDTIAAMRMIWEQLKLVVEPSSATVLAALIKHRDQFQGRTVGLILSGGNLDLDNIPFSQ